jgi:hypothetical protein
LELVNWTSFIDEGLKPLTSLTRMSVPSSAGARDIWPVAAFGREPDQA